MEYETRLIRDEIMQLQTHLFCEQSSERYAPWMHYLPTGSRLLHTGCLVLTKNRFCFLTPFFDEYSDNTCSSYFWTNSRGIGLQESFQNQVLSPNTPFSRPFVKTLSWCRSLTQSIEHSSISTGAGWSAEFLQKLLFLLQIPRSAGSRVPFHLIWFKGCKFVHLCTSPPPCGWIKQDLKMSA